MNEPEFYRRVTQPSYLISRADFAYNLLRMDRKNLKTAYHTHDFYEITLISKGKCRHFINGKTEILRARDLFFVRDTDAHYFEPCDEDGYELQCLSFDKSVFLLLSNYLGDSFDYSEIFSAETPPIFNLSPLDCEYLVKKLHFFSANVNKGKKTVDKLGKQILFRCMTNYFSKPDEILPKYETDLPEWFAVMCSKMDINDNWKKGISQFSVVSNKSQSTINQAMKKYLGTTPTKYITERKLQLAEKCLRTTDSPVTDIYMYCGFENESWFYKKFRERYGDTPDEYRRKNRE